MAIPVDLPAPGTAETARGPPCQSAILCCPGRKSDRKRPIASSRSAVGEFEVSAEAICTDELLSELFGIFYEQQRQINRGLAIDLQIVDLFQSDGKQR